MASLRSPSRAGVSILAYPYIGRRSERSVSTEIRMTGALSNRGPTWARRVPLHDGTGRSRKIPPRRAARRAGAILIRGRRITSTLLKKNALARRPGHERSLWESLEPGPERDQVRPGNLERRRQAGAGGRLAELRVFLPVGIHGRALRGRSPLWALDRRRRERIEADETAGVGGSARAGEDRRADGGRVVDERHAMSVEEVEDLRHEEDLDRSDLAGDVDGEVGPGDRVGAIGVAIREVVRHGRRRVQVTVGLARRGAPEAGADVGVRPDGAGRAVGRAGVPGLEQPRGDRDRAEPRVVGRVDVDAMPLVLGEIALRRVPGGLHVLGVVEPLVCQGAAAGILADEVADRVRPRPVAPDVQRAVPVGEGGVQRGVVARWCVRVDVEPEVVDVPEGVGNVPGTQVAIEGVEVAELAADSVHAVDEVAAEVAAEPERVLVRVGRLHWVKDHLVHAGQVDGVSRDGREHAGLRDAEGSVHLLQNLGRRGARGGAGGVDGCPSPVVVVAGRRAGRGAAGARDTLLDLADVAGVAARHAELPVSLDVVRDGEPGAELAVVRDEVAARVEGVVLVPADAEVEGEAVVDLPVVVHENRLRLEFAPLAQHGDRVVLEVGAGVDDRVEVAPLLDCLLY